MCVCMILMYKAACVQPGLTSCHFKAFAVRVTKCLYWTAIYVCLSVSSDFCLCLPPSVIISTCQCAPVWPQFEAFLSSSCKLFSLLVDTVTWPVSPVSVLSQFEGNALVGWCTFYYLNRMLPWPVLNWILPTVCKPYLNIGKMWRALKLYSIIYSRYWGLIMNDKLMTIRLKAYEVRPFRAQNDLLSAQDFFMVL